MTIEQIRQLHIKWGISEKCNSEILKLFKDSYSEEEVKVILSKLLDDLTEYGGIENLTKWFNQNKKQ